MIRLSREICGKVIVRFLRLECRVPKIAPQNRVHSERVGFVEYRGYFLKLALRFL